MKLSTLLLSALLLLGFIPAALAEIVPVHFVQGSDYADGDAGGPDNWIVTGVANNDRLNIRTAPSPSASLVARVKNGTVLRNLGCRTKGPSRWCRVATRLNNRGWVNGRFLREY